MSKKFFTLLFLAVFMLAQFSTASATAVDATTALTALDAFHNGTDPVTLDWSVSGMPNTGTQNVFIWMKADPSFEAFDWMYDAVNTRCILVQNVNGLTSANGSFDWALPIDANDDQDVVEFLVTVDDAAGCATAEVPAAGTESQAGTFIDARDLVNFMGWPPALTPAYYPLSCNTFEYWALVSDSWLLGPGAGYSGFKAWNQSVTGTFAAPAPEGPADQLLSWVYTFPSTASGSWEFSIQPEDMAGNTAGGPSNFRAAAPDVSDEEKEACADFTDTAGHADETYIRYLADLGLISGFADGSYGPDTTLTRAEAATLFEKANGVTDADPGFGTPPAAGSPCDFSDVSAADWFAGWVWQACADGFMNGIGGGMFDPNNLLTRGQVVTIMNNIATSLPAAPPTYSSFLDAPSVLYYAWGLPSPYPYRSGAWTDVAIGAYYATPVIQAYGWGVADGTSDTTFSPDQAATRGEFAKMLYRALSWVD